MTYPRFVGILLCAVSITSLASCGDDDEPSTADTGTPTPPPPADTGTPPPPPIDGGARDTGTPTPPPPADMGTPDAPRPDAGPPGPTVTMSGRVGNFLGGSPVADLRFCIYELPDVPCATTGADGTYALAGIPADSELRVTYRDDAEQWQPTMVHVATGTEDFTVNFVAIELLVAEGLAMDAGIELDPERAIVVFNAFGPAMEGPIAGASATLDPDDAEARAFISATYAVDTMATSTSTIGLGFFANVPAGPHTLAYTHPDRDCVLQGGWPGDSANEARLDVVGGWFVTPGAATCSPR